MDNTPSHRVFENYSSTYGLHAAALSGDDTAVQRAIDAGANINALDSAGRTIVMCAVAGDKYVIFSCPCAYLAH